MQTLKRTQGTTYTVPYASNDVNCSCWVLGCYSIYVYLLVYNSLVKTNIFSKISILFVAAFFFGMTFSTAHAAEYYICSGDISNPSDWWDSPDCSGTSGTIPNSGEIGHVVGTVNSDSNPAFDFLLIVDGQTFNINNDFTLEGGYINVINGGTLNVTAGTLYIQSGSMTIDSSSQMNISGAFNIGQGPILLEGAMQVNDGGSIDVVLNQLQIYGGTLDINSGGTVTVNRVTPLEAKIDISDTGTLNVKASGTLIVTTGATTTNNGTFTSQGTVTVSDTGVLENNNANYFTLNTLVGTPVSFDPLIDAHSQNYNVLFAHTPVSYSAVGLPDGLAINGSTGLITGTSTGAGSGSFYVVSTGSTARQKFNYNIGVLDAIAPEITNLAATPGSADVVIAWNTGESSSSNVLYGLTPSGYATTSELNTSPRVTDHSVNITSLVPCTTYHYKVVSRDAALNVGSSSDAVFTTSGCPGSAPIQSSTTSISIISSTGGTVSFDAATGRTLELDVPALFTSSTSAQFSIKELGGSALFGAIGKPSGVVSVGDGFDIKALTSATSTVSNFDNPIQISISYTHAEIVNIVESSLRIYAHNGTSWSVLTNCVVNSVTDVVTCDTNHFSVFALFGTTVVTTTSSTSGPSGGGSASYSFSQPMYGVRANGTKSTATVTVYAFDSNMRLGSVGLSVKNLQKYLNTKGFTVSNSGSGSVGKETEFFGPRTAQALKKFQAHHKLPATGFFGPMTRQVISSLK